MTFLHCLLSWATVLQSSSFTYGNFQSIGNCPRMSFCILVRLYHTMGLCQEMHKVHIIATKLQFVPKKLQKKITPMIHNANDIINGIIHNPR